MPLRAAVFDFDGVIVDSEPVHFGALRDALASDGVAITREEYWSLYLAYDDHGAIRRALEHHRQAAPNERVDAIVRRKVARFAQLIPEIPVFAGVPALVRALAAEMPLAIASGARHDEIDQILAGIGLASAFSAVVGAEDAPRTKPDPAPYLEASCRLAALDPALTPGACLAFEDSVPGIVSAIGAGMRVVGVTNSYPAEKLQSAHHVVASLAGVASDDLRRLFPD